MRSALVLLLLLWGASGCGDDDIGSSSDAGFSVRDAGRDAGCLPYYLSDADRVANAHADDAGSVDPSSDASTTDASVDASSDASVDANGDESLEPISCNHREGDVSAQCNGVDWSFAGGEHIELPGCCTPDGSCGVFDPTGRLGCMETSIFGLAAGTCTPQSRMDGGADDANVRDQDASAI